MMPEDMNNMTRERKDEIKNTIMSVLFDLYEHQTGVKFTWEEVKEPETA